MDVCTSCSVSFYFFFFKQKTAYEMRISDWSSDVCSSDLRCQNCAVMCVARGTELEGRTADGVIKPLRSDRDASRDRIIGCECTGLQQIEHGIADQPTDRTSVV